MTEFARVIRCETPELLLIAVACLQFLIGPFLTHEGAPTSRRIGRLWGTVSLLALLGALGVWQYAPTLSGTSFFTGDSFAWFGRSLSILAGIVLVLINWDEISNDFAAEFQGSLLLIVAGVSLTAAANDLIVLFLALELVSIPTYVFLYLPRREPTSPEATTKYFLLSIFSSAIVLYGFSFLYGAVGSTQLSAIHRALAEYPAAQSPAILLIAAACIVAGLSFRITAVPFHFYAPDVFQGSHPGAAALLAFVPKVAGFLALYRIVHFEGIHLDSSADELRVWCETIFALMALFSMFLGNVLALLQRDLKRLLAYSSIAHAGYMLVGLAAGHRPTAVAGQPALLFYLVAYGATIAGVFGMIVMLKRNGRCVTTVDDLAGLSQTHPAAAAVLMILLFSLTGLPPTGGFLGKLNLLMAAWSQQSYWSEFLAIALAVNAAIAAGYYLRIVAAMYLRPPAPDVTIVTTRHLPALLGVAVCVIVSLGLFFFPSLLWDVVAQFAT